MAFALCKTEILPVISCQLIGRTNGHSDLWDVDPLTEFLLLSWQERQTYKYQTVKRRPRDQCWWSRSQVYKSLSASDPTFAWTQVPGSAKPNQHSDGSSFRGLGLLVFVSRREEEVEVGCMNRDWGGGRGALKSGEKSLLASWNCWWWY